MSDSTKSEIWTALQNSGADLEERQRKLIANANPDEQELLDNLLALASPLTDFQEEWFNEQYRTLSREFRSAALGHAKSILGAGPPDTELDKFQIATIRLIETINGYFSGRHAVDLNDSARATCEVIYGLIREFQKNNLLPKDLEIVYKLPKDVYEGADENTLISADLHRTARTNSNSSKHADRDARQVRSYSDITNLQHLLFSMVQDYETLHCALLDAGLLSTELERLYPIERSTLVKNGHRYKSLYDPNHIDVSATGSMSEVTMASLFKDVSDQFDNSEVYVPAATLACLTLKEDCFHARHSQDIRESALEKMHSLRIWPIIVSTNSRIVRDPNILDLHNERAP